MLLLYDNVTIPSFIEWDDYSSLTETGYVKINTYDDMAEYINNIYDELDYEYGQYIKPALLNSIKEVIAPFNYIKFESDLRFASLIYDLYWWNKIDNKQFNQMLNNNLVSLGINAEVFSDKVDLIVKFHNNILLNYIAFLFDWIDVHLNDFLWNIELSYLYDAIIFNSNYKIERIGLNSKIKPKEDMSTYRILKAELKNLIGVLPHADSLDEIFRIKDKNRKDIIRLRNVIDELEKVLRECGSEKMVQEASNNITKASRELAKTNRLDKISKWTTYLSVPIAAIETLITPVPVAGIALGTIGTYTTAKSQIIQQKNNWISVIR